MASFFVLPSARRLFLWLSALISLGVCAPWLHKENFLATGGITEEMTPLPEFPSTSGDWIGTEPMSRDDLRGQVWVLKVWTFGCVNCVRSIPFTNELMTRFGGGVRVLGIHSPEYDWERDPEALAAVLTEEGVQFPSYIDQSLDYFLTLEAPGWPAYYIIDRQARIRGRWVGEVHSGTMRDRSITALIRALLDEPL